MSSVLRPGIDADWIARARRRHYMFGRMFELTGQQTVSHWVTAGLGHTWHGARSWLIAAPQRGRLTRSVCCANTRVGTGHNTHGCKPASRLSHRVVPGPHHTVLPLRSPHPPTPGRSHPTPRPCCHQADWTCGLAEQQGRMPKRATLTYTSEDAPKVDQTKLFVYYCKFSGKHAFTIGRSTAPLGHRPPAHAAAALGPRGLPQTDCHDLDVWLDPDTAGDASPRGVAKPTTHTQTETSTRCQSGGRMGRG